MMMDKLVSIILDMNDKDTALLAEAIVMFNQNKADRLIRALEVAQREEDERYLELEKQYEMMSYADQAADMDAVCYGER